MAKKRTVDQILNETSPGPSKDIYKKKWDEFNVLFGVLQPQWLRMRELPHNNYKGRSGGKVSTAQKYVDESESGTQAIASVFNESSHNKQHYSSKSTRWRACNKNL